MNRRLRGKAKGKAKGDITDIYFDFVIRKIFPSPGTPAEVWVRVFLRLRKKISKKFQDFQ